jgi:hypothetical protein
VDTEKICFKYEFFSITSVYHPVSLNRLCQISFLKKQQGMEVPMRRTFDLNVSKSAWVILTLVLLLIALSGCLTEEQVASFDATSTAQAVALDWVVGQTKTATAATPTPTVTQTPTFTPTVTNTPLPTNTLAPTPVPDRYAVFGKDGKFLYAAPIMPLCDGMDAVFNCSGNKIYEIDVNGQLNPEPVKVIPAWWGSILPIVVGIGVFLLFLFIVIRSVNSLPKIDNKINEKRQIPTPPIQNQEPTSIVPDRSLQILISEIARSDRALSVDVRNFINTVQNQNQGLIPDEQGNNVQQYDPRAFGIILNLMAQRDLHLAKRLQEFIQRRKR